MPGRDERIYQEACALWRELYGEAPPTQADGQTMLDMITRRLTVGDYDRLTSPFMRPSSVCYPKDG